MNTKTTNTILIAMLTATVACGGHATKDADRTATKNADRTATFTEMTATQLSEAYFVGSGMDLIQATVWGTAPIFESQMGSPCIAVTDVESGVQYEYNGSPGCDIEFSGTITTYGDTVNGGEGTIVWDHMAWAENDPDGSYAANGTLAVGPGYMDADLVHTLPGFSEIENHARFEIEGDFMGAMSGEADALLVHGPGSWAAIDGLGSFDLAGTHDLASGEMDIVLTGTDTLTIYMAPDFACYSVEINGEPVELESEIAQCDAPASYEASTVGEACSTATMSGDANALLVHGPGSWAAIDGLGSFGLAGTHDLATREGNLVSTGTDSPAINMASDFAHYSVDLNGEPVDFEGAVARGEAAVSYEDSTVCGDWSTTTGRSIRFEWF